MKKLRATLYGFLIMSIFLSGCDLLLNADSDRIVLPDDHQLNSPNDTLYSMIGIFSRLEKVMDRYVLLGELRGDLMDITENANPDLQEIYNFDISEDNPYNKIEDYYAVINNCNYVIANIDTALVLNAEKVMLKEYAAAKAIRAWTYMQIALNYGSAKYFDEPILSVKDSANYTEYTLQEMIPFLTQDLEPWKGIDPPGGVFFGVQSSYLYFPVRFVLADLYLWNGEYEKAAREYHDLMEDRSFVVNPQFRSTWTVENGVFVERELEDQNWLLKFDGFSTDLITAIAGYTEYGGGAPLDSLSLFHYEIAPSSVAFNTWESQIYYYNAVVATEGDLRGDIGSYIKLETLLDFDTDLLEETPDIDKSLTPIIKYDMLGGEVYKAVSIYRSTLLYLRYAEAVNRLGKPNLAFAVLKHGLSSDVMEVDSIVPRSEKFSVYTDSTGSFFDYVNFEDQVFDANIGVHEGGCGFASLARDYIIPPLASTQDSILYVEDEIIEELALEMAFEGNRFHDLMRIALRRGNPAYLSDAVSDKYADKSAMQSKLSDEANWYIK